MQVNGQEQGYLKKKRKKRHLTSGGEGVIVKLEHQQHPSKLLNTHQLIKMLKSIFFFHLDHSAAPTGFSNRMTFLN